MHLGIVAKILGYLVMGLGLIGILPLLLSIVARDTHGPWPWLIMISLAGVVGGGLAFAGHKAPGKDLGIREGVAVTSLVWVVASLVSAVGIWFAAPMATFMEAWFEAMSGFTTSGSTVFGSIAPIESLDHSLLLWRSIMQWMGGIGIVVISLALLPLLAGGSGFQLYRAEVPGITADRLAPRIADTARLLVGFYMGLTVAIVLGLLACGVSLFDAVCHAMTTASTGGFSPYDDSAEGLDSIAAEWVLIVGMLVSAINFGLLILALRGKPLKIWQNNEARVFLILVTLACAIVIIDLALFSSLYLDDWHGLIRDSIFQVISLSTSTGYGTGFDSTPGFVGWEGWPAAATSMMVMFMVMGGCTGSTAGGTKVIRWIVMWKASRRELKRYAEPARVIPVRIDGKTIGDRVILQVAAFFMIYTVTWVLGTVAISLSGIDLLTAGTAALTCISNIGPGMGSVGAADNFHHIGTFGQFACIVLMLLGRLEFFGVIAVCSLSYWRS
jgi:trk system potassium uptake protein TrkH